MIKDFLNTLPLISDLHHPAMRERHWDILRKVTNSDFVLDDEFSMDGLLKLQLHKFEDDVGEIVNRAQKEEKMEAALKKISQVP